MVGSKVQYSNLGMGLLGHILSLIADEPSEQIVVERICKPLGMLDTSIAFSPEQL